MELRPLPLISALVILVLAGAGLWYVLSRPSPEVPPGSGLGPTEEDPEKLYIRENKEYYEIEAAYPSRTPLKETAGAKADGAIVALLKLFAEKEVARFKDSSMGEITPEDVQVQGLGGERKYAFAMDYEIRESNDTVSYIFLMFEDTLGAHPNAYFRTFVFNKKTGEGVHLDDLFSSDEYLEVLSEKSRASLKETLGEDASIDMLEAGTTPDIDNYYNFYLDGDAFVLIFPPYQVGPWAIGTQEVRIPRSELSAVLRSEYR